MTLAEEPERYRSTTTAHMVRFVAIWVTAAGAGLLVLTSGQLFVWDDPGGLLLALALVGGGGVAWLAARTTLATLRRENRPYLLSARGIQAMAGRERVAARVRAVQRWTLATFVVAGIVMIYAASAMACEGRPEYLCGLPPVDRSVFLIARTVAVATGAGFVALVVLGRSHAHETERMDAVIGEGQRRRREGPVPGLSRHRWE